MTVVSQNACAVIVPIFPHLQDLGKEYTEDMSQFYNASQVAVTSYLARAVVNIMLTGDVFGEIKGDQAVCKVS